MRILIATAFFVGLTATTFAAGRRSVPIQYQTTGADAEYVHGKHCIDGRTF